MANGPTKLPPTPSQVTLPQTPTPTQTPTSPQSPTSTPTPGSPGTPATSTAQRRGRPTGTGPTAPGTPTRDVAPSEARTAEARRRASTTVTGAELSRGQAARQAAPFTTARVAGRVATPKVVLEPVDALRRLETGRLDVTLPLRETDLGLVSIRPDTNATVALAVKNGKIDYRETRIEFKRDNGESTDLDGPLWWDAESVYIDSDGQIRAEVPCFPDPNITEKVLGEGTDKVPEDPAEFLSKLTRGNDPQVNIHAGSNAEQQPATGRPAGSTRPARGGATPTGNVPDATPGLTDALDLAHTRASFTGTFRPGPIAFGDGTTVVMRPGATVNASGTLSDMSISVDAPVASMSMESEGTRFSTGQAQVGLNIRLAKPTGGNNSTTITVDSLDASEVSFETPTAHGQNELTIRDLQVNGREGFPPLLRMENQPDGTKAMTVNLPEVELNDVSGNFHVIGADGQPATVRLGDDDPATDMNVTGSVVFDSQRDLFAFNSRVENLAASVGRVDLVDSAGFDLTLASGQVSGSGQFAVTRHGDDSRLTMTADEGTEWVMDARIDDAQIGADAPSSKINVDVASETGGQLRLRNLAFGGDGPPTFDGEGEFQVVLDHLRVPLGDGQAVELRPGTTGKLTIDKMAWAEGDRSPEVSAQLRLEMGADVVIEPGEIKGLKGARVEIDVETGRSVLVLDATLDRQGNLTAECGVRLHGVGVATSLTKGDVAPAPDVQIPEQPLGPVEPITMAPVRMLPLTPVPAQRAADTLPAAPTITPLRIRPSDLLGAVDETTVNITVPMDRLDRARIAGTDTTRVVDVGLWDDKVGYRASLDLSHRQGPLAVGLQVEDGKVKPETSRITADPPIVIDIDWAAYGAGPVSAGSHEQITVRALVVKRDPDTGEGYLWPEGDLDGTLGDTAEFVGLDDWIKRQAGEAIAERVFGSERFPLEMARLMPTLPKVGEAIVVEPQLPSLDGEQPGAPGGATPTPATPAPATPTAPRTGTPLDQVTGAIHFDQAQIEVERCALRPTTIELGDGQKITFNEGSELAVSGTPDDYTISGTAVLGELAIGDDNDVRLGLDSGRAEVRIRVTANPEGGKPRIQIAIDELEADNLSVGGQLGQMRSGLSGIDVGHAEPGEPPPRKGSIRIAFGGNEPSRVKVELPDAKATFNAEGSVSARRYQGEAKKLTAELEGDLLFVNGRISGEFTHVELDGSGLTFSRPSARGTDSGSLHVEGAARLSTDRNGVIQLSPLAEGTPALSVEANITLENGTKLEVEDGHARSIAFGAKTSTVELSGLDARVKALIPLKRGEDGAPDSVLDIRSAQVQGDLRVGPEGFRALGDLRIDQFDGSITQLNGIRTDAGAFDMRQIDLTGSGVLTSDADGGLDLRGHHVMRDGEEHSTLEVRAIADEFRFTTTSPKIDFDMAAGAQVQAEVDTFRLSKDLRSVGINLRHGRFDGELDGGSVAVAKPGSVLENLSLSRGTRLSAEIPLMQLATGAYAESGKADLRIQGTMRVEGAVDQVPGRIPSDLEVAGDQYRLEALDLEGRFRMIVGVNFDDGAFSTRSRTLIDASANARATGNVDGRTAYGRARREVERRSGGED